jgi:hypothetical protein
VRPFISAGSRARVVVPIATFILCLCPGAWLVFQTVRAAWRVTDVNLTDRSNVEVGRFVRQHLPETAVLFCEEPQGYEHLTLMFHADRTCYLLGPGLVDERARQVEGAGGIAYVVTRRRLALEAVHVRPGPGPTVYRWKAP